MQKLIKLKVQIVKGNVHPRRRLLRAKPRLLHRSPSFLALPAPQDSSVFAAESESPKRVCVRFQTVKELCLYREGRYLASVTEIWAAHSGKEEEDANRPASPTPWAGDVKKYVQARPARHTAPKVDDPEEQQQRDAGDI